MIYAQNYGEAGCMEYYRRKFDLPPAFSGHNSYWLWGRDELTDAFDTVILIGGNIGDHKTYLNEVEQAAVFQCRYCMPYENDLPLFVGSGFSQNPTKIWPYVKHYQ